MWEKYASILEAILVFGGSRIESQAELYDFIRQVQSMTVKDRTLDYWVKPLTSQHLVDGPPYKLGPGLGLVVGVAVGSESVRAGLYDANGEQVAPRAFDAEPQLGQLQGHPSLIIDRVCQAVERVLEESDAALQMESAWVRGVSVALPAPIDRAGHVDSVCPSPWREKPFIEPLRSALLQVSRIEKVISDAGANSPFMVDVVNDANADVIDLAFDLARSQPSAPDDYTLSKMLMSIRLGGGVGAGILKLGRFAPAEGFALSRSHLIVGSRGLAGEIGHCAVIEPAGGDALSYEGCSCGAPNERHVEGFISARAVMSRMNKTVGEQVDLSEALGPQFERLYAARDDVLRRELRAVGKLLGQSMATSIRLLDPAVIQLTGALSVHEVQWGVNAEAERWGSGPRNDVSVTFGASPYCAARGAALMLLRSQVYRRIAEISQQVHTQR